MTNPNNAVGTNGAFGGRTSVNAFNDIMGAFQSRGILSGWGIVPSSGMTVSIGGNGTTRDVAVAEDAIGNKTSVNNISGTPISVTLNSAPASNSRYDAIVAYVDKPPIGNATQDNPECCGIIPVTGTAASTPAYPDDAAIRSAITADGASGATAYYVVLGYVLVASGTTAITSAMITAGLSPTTNAMVDTANIQDGAVTSDKIDFTTFGWEPYPGITAAAGITIGENHSSINRRLGLICVHLNLALSNGIPGTVASGLPNPFNDSVFLYNRIYGGSKDGQSAFLWVRKNGGTIGSGAVPDAVSLGISAMYPIATSNS